MRNQLAYADQGTQYSYAVPSLGPTPACSQVCQTKIPAAQSAVFFNQTPASSGRTAVGTAAASFNFYYKDCISDSNGNYACPIDPTKSETIVKKCACGGDFGNAVGALSAVNNAAQDAICSAP